MTTSEAAAIGDWVYVGPARKPAKVTGLAGNGTAIVEYLVGGLADVVALPSCEVYRRFGDAAEPAKSFAPLGSRENPILSRQSYYRRCKHATLSPPFVPGKAFRIVAYIDVGGWCPRCEQQQHRAKSPKPA